MSIRPFVAYGTKTQLEIDIFVVRVFNHINCKNNVNIFLGLLYSKTLEERHCYYLPNFNIKFD